MLSSSASCSLPLGLLYLVLSFGLSGTDASPTPDPVPVSSPGQTINIRRRGNPHVDDVGAWLQKNRQATHAKYGVGAQSGQQKRGTGMNLLTDLAYDSTYFGSIAVGTPPTSFDVILDTGSADLWLASDASATQGRGSRGIALFEPTSSSTFQDLNQPFGIQYGSGNAQGVLGVDKVQFAGFEVNQTFALVNQTSSQLLTEPISGLMGLGFQTIASSRAKPFWESLTDTSGVLDEPLFAFQLTRFTNASNAESLEYGGTFNIGATNSSLFTGNIDYQDIPAGAPGYWIQELTGLKVNGQSISIPSGQDAWAAIDTGTTGVGMPPSVQQALFANVPNSQQGSGQYEGYYLFPCSESVTIEVQWGGSNQSWSISPADFALQQAGDDTCVGAFFDIPTNTGSSAPPFIFGDTFLKNVYSVFRANPGASSGSSQGSVGFAALSSASLSQNGGDLAVPSATIGAVASITSTSNSPFSGNSNGAARAGVMSPAVALFSVFFGAVLVLL